MFAGYLTTRPGLGVRQNYSTLRLRLGLDQLPAGYRCLTHGCDFDSMGHHALSCQNLQGAIDIRHDLILDEIFSQCLFLDRTSQLIQRIERSADEAPNGVDTNPMIEQWAGGRTVPGDIVVRLARKRLFKLLRHNSGEQPHATGGSMPGGLADLSEGLQDWLGRAYRRKMDKHGVSVSEFGGRFVHDRCLAFRFPPKASQIIQLRIRKEGYQNRRAGSPFSQRLASHWQGATHLSYLQRGICSGRKPLKAGIKRDKRLAAELHQMQSFN